MSEEVLNVSADKNGRFLILNASIDDDGFCFVNSYAPNDQNQQIYFYEKMINSIRCHQTANILIGEDFSCPLSALDKFSGKDVQAKKAVIWSIEELCNKFSLVDPWREQHPHETRFTWRNSSGKMKLRLDFWLISKRLLSRVAKTGICIYYDSDHSPVTISIIPEGRYSGISISLTLGFSNLLISQTKPFFPWICIPWAL